MWILEYSTIPHLSDGHQCRMDRRPRYQPLSESEDYFAQDMQKSLSCSCCFWDDAWHMLPVLRMTTASLEHGSSFTSNATDKWGLVYSYKADNWWSTNHTSPKVKSHLQLQAAISLLHHVVVEAYSATADADFALLARPVHTFSCISP